MSSSTNFSLPLGVEAAQAARNKALWEAKGKAWKADRTNRETAERKAFQDEIDRLRSQRNKALAEVKKLKAEAEKLKEAAKKAESKKKEKASKAEHFESDAVMVEHDQIKIPKIKVTNAERTQIAIAKDILELLEVVYNVEDPPPSSLEAAGRLKDDLYEFTDPDAN
ncbi:uncharacterized protein J3D65DRAFT_605958 [Phyllosticta citribraziliensis]|uniref:Uncharacterized protein n=1 Tax=Phyllosticta citribraziliensis TaxID=989973 RepID=A0ABR1LBE6_9PEZI